MSQILHQSPFSPDLLAHNEAQLDFILECYATDHPKEMQFVRRGKVPEGVAKTVANKEWADVLRGRALEEFMGPRLPSANVLAALRARHEAGIVKPVPVRRRPSNANDKH